jgi:hypothetical protein
VFFRVQKRSADQEQSIGCHVEAEVSALLVLLFFQLDRGFGYDVRSIGAMMV